MAETATLIVTDTIEIWHRMVIDDRKELLTRAEIMNRVYLQDISKLDGDINRLEKLLDRDIHHTGIATLDNVNILLSILLSI